MNPCQFTSFHVSLLMIFFFLLEGLSEIHYFPDLSIINTGKWSSGRILLPFSAFPRVFIVFCFILIDFYVSFMIIQQTRYIQNKSCLSLGFPFESGLGRGRGDIHVCIPPPWIRQWTQKNLSFHYKLSKVVFL